jgi:hypothetical protein
MNHERDTPSPQSWREYRDSLSMPPHTCQHCGQPIVSETYAMLADGKRFCSSACYESWVRR